MRQCVLGILLLLCGASAAWGQSKPGSCQLWVSGSQTGTVHTLAVAVWDHKRGVLTLECRMPDGTPVMTLGGRLTSSREAVYPVGPVELVGRGGNFGGSVSLLYGPNDARNAVFQSSQGSVKLSGASGQDVGGQGEMDAKWFWGHRGNIHVRFSVSAPIVDADDVSWR